MPDNYFDLERAATARLLEAIQSRTAAEADLTSVFQIAEEKAEKEISRARKTNNAARQSELGKLEEEHTREALEITRKYDAEQFAVSRTREESRERKTEKYEAAEQRGRLEYKDRVWHIDSMLEAGEKAAKEQLESLQRKAAGGLERVDKLWTDTEPVLHRGRTQRVEIEYQGEMPPPSDDDPISRMNKGLQESQTALAALVRLKSPGLGRVPAILLFLILGFGLGAAVSFPFLPSLTQAVVLTGVVGVIIGLGIWLVVRWLGRRTTLDNGRRLGLLLADATRACHMLNDYAAKEYVEERARLSERHTRKRRETDDYYLPMFESQKTHFESELQKVDKDYATNSEKIRRGRAAEIQAEADSFNDRRAKIEGRLNAELKAAEDQFQQKMAAATAARDAAWERMASGWRNVTQSTCDTFRMLQNEGKTLFPAWEEVERDDRPLSNRVPEGIRCGDMVVDMKSLPGGVPADQRLYPPKELAGLVPAFLPFPDRCSVLLRARDEGRTAAVTSLQAMMLRFLTGLPPGKVRFTIIDPVGLGENFAAFMHLADHDEKLVTAQIWTEPIQIEQRLVDLTDHIASVIQKYLRNQYKTIEDYNRAAGEVAEPYRVLVIANFPTNFTPDAAKRLISVASSGPSCGVCTLVSADTRIAMPRDFNIADLESVSHTLVWKDGVFTPKDPALAAFPFVADKPPDTAVVSKMVQRIGKASKDAVRVEVPFDYIAPAAGMVWKGDASRGFDVPVGRAGATRKQTFGLGRGTAQHALIAGKTGSGKSTLLHALITNLSLIYSPEEAELYLIDFKEGVEFQWYATYRLPHARVVAIQSEREFGLSVLQRLDVVLRERGEKFRNASVNDLASYRAAQPQETTPRILLVVDEFQAFFTEDDKLAQEASLLLDRLVRQGRAFGLHVLLGSQTLGGAYSLARSTIDQMAVRVALQCSDADAQLILSKDNSAARLLSRPGEAIYNDQNGLVEGNDPFQVVWLSDEKREQLLSELHERAANHYPPPLVFSGNSAADIDTNKAISRLVDSPAATKSPVAWLGDPVAIKDPTAAVFRQIGGSNLLLIGQNEPAARGLFTSSLIGLVPQLPSEISGPAFTILDGTPDDVEDAEYFPKLAAKLPHAVAPPRSGLPAAIRDLALELERRQKGESNDRSPRFLFVFGIHRFRELRKVEEEFGFGRRDANREPSPTERFAAILRDGPPVGIHVVGWCDSLTNLNRAFERPQLREFSQRVLFQMSATDSSTLMDTPAASKLGRNRALYLQEDQERPEKFRPYGVPSMEWINQISARLQPRIGLKAEPAGV
jgi:S-DNA-T family DNA segregation ATPase FtsK/SpoIIIE